MMLSEATHILTRHHINAADLEHARALLLTAVQEFESIYGVENMVFNVHLLLHTVTCVEKNGPLSTYSNYSTEDNLGHLMTFVKGPTDVLYQVCDRYLLEKHLNNRLEDAPLAKEFYAKIKHRTLRTISKINDNLLVGKPQKISIEHHDWIFGQLGPIDIKQVKSYRAVYVNSKIYLESATPNTARKNTYDSFVCIPEMDIYGEILQILVWNDRIYLDVHNMYSEATIYSAMRVLKTRTEPHRDLISLDPTGIAKYALIKRDEMVVCSEFPNLFERN